MTRSGQADTPLSPVVLGAAGAALAAVLGSALIRRRQRQLTDARVSLDVVDHPAAPDR